MRLGNPLGDSAGAFPKFSTSTPTANRERQSSPEVKFTPWLRFLPVISFRVKCATDGRLLFKSRWLRIPVEDRLTRPPTFDNASAGYKFRRPSWLAVQQLSRAGITYFDIDKHVSMVLVEPMGIF
jgi:hypothetical protein